MNRTYEEWVEKVTDSSADIALADMLADWQADIIRRMKAEHALNKRIAELEAEIDQLTADSTDERKDDKLPEREVCEACGGDGTLLLVDNYKGQATATVDCPYCNGTGRVNKECEK